MTPFLRKVLRVGVVASAVCQRLLNGITLVFRGKKEVARRTSGRLEILKRKEMELERLDRLRHPSNYQGR